jgi:hypothetical protein
VWKNNIGQSNSLHSKYSPHEENCALLGTGKDIVQIIRNTLTIKTVSGNPGILIIDQIETLDKQTINEIAGILAAKI